MVVFSRKILGFAALLVFVGMSEAADPDTPHAHNGKAKPFKPGAPDVTLSVKDLEALKIGNTVKRQVIDIAAGTATVLAVQDVAAPDWVVFERICAFEEYPKMVSGVAVADNYYEVVHGNKTKTIKTYLALKAAVMTFGGYFVHSVYPPPLSSVTWTLDYDRTSDYVDSVGYWHVARHPDYPETRARVFYSVNLMPADWVPSWIVDILQKQALGQATAWVKLESEKRAPKLQPAPAQKGGGKSGAGVAAKGGSTGRARESTFECVWWSLYGDLLSDRARPADCDGAVEPEEKEEEKETSWSLSSFFGY